MPDNWISTEDRLPETDGCVLVCIDVNVPWLSRAVRLGWYQDQRWRTQLGSIKARWTITHWRPLPEVPDA